MPNDKPLSPQGYNIGVDPINTNPFFDGVPGGGGGGGATAYNQLTGRPFINGKVLEGNKDLKLTTPEELQAAKTELTSSVTQEEEARIAEDEAIRQEIKTISMTPGPPGNDGAPGSDGRAATVRVGSTETVEPGTPASVTNTGTENAAVLNFKIPRGIQGIQGIQGLPGADGSPGKDFTYEDFTPEQLEALRGPQGIQGVPGNDGAPGVAGKIQSVSAETVPYTEEASVQNTGTEENAILHFKIPQGIPGTSGGEGGATVTVNVGTTTTGEPGTNAEVTNRGTEENVVLDFKIPRGNTGAPGAPGADGSPGKDFTYEDFTAEQLEALRGPQGIQGVPGSDGAPGVDGKAATIQVGSTETVEPGTPASVTNTGTENAAVLTFKIPRGNTGAPGAPGADGSPGKDFTYEDFTPEQLEALRGPQGIPGAPGSDGAPGVDGRAATIRVGTTETLAPGTDASVENTGTENAAILTFKIPRGNTGETGPAGKDGINGKDFTYEDFTPEQLEALRGPQGIPGAPGSDGAPGVEGKAATIRVGTVTTLPAGSDATVTNSGTENTAILNFGIPQGIQGEPGSGGGSGGTVEFRADTVQTILTNAMITDLSEAGVVRLAWERKYDGGYVTGVELKIRFVSGIDTINLYCNIPCSGEIGGHTAVLTNGGYFTCDMVYSGDMIQIEVRAITGEVQYTRWLSGTYSVTKLKGVIV